MNKIEQRLQNILRSIGLDMFFEYNYRFKRYFIDFADKTNKIAIEVQGTYWHGHFLTKNSQKSRIRRTKDRIKRTTLETNGWFIIYIWEHSLNRYPRRLSYFLNKEIFKRIKI